MSTPLESHLEDSDVPTVPIDIHFFGVEVADSYFRHFSSQKEWVAPILLSSDRKSSIAVYVGKITALSPALTDPFRCFRSSYTDGAICMLVVGNPE